MPLFIFCILAYNCLLTMDMPKLINFCGGGASISITEGSLEIISTVQCSECNATFSMLMFLYTGNFFLLRWVLCLHLKYYLFLTFTSFYNYILFKGFKWVKRKRISKLSLVLVVFRFYFIFFGWHIIVQIKTKDLKNFVTRICNIIYVSQKYDFVERFKV